MSETDDLNTNKQRLIRKTTGRVMVTTRKYGSSFAKKISQEHDGICGHEYGVNGHDFFERKCPVCQGGKQGLSVY